MIHGVEQAGARPRPRSLGEGRGRKLDAIVGDGPDDLDAQLAHIRVLPRWIGNSIALAIALAVWGLIIFGVHSLLA
jgi:hypothetical protein